VTEQSDALDLEKGVFAGRDPHRIALSLKRSAERSRRRKSEPFRSAMSMLNFYINRAGRKMSADRKRILDRAKDELRRVFGRPSAQGKQGRATGSANAGRKRAGRATRPV
jgi:hypothetical protein